MSAGDEGSSKELDAVEFAPPAPPKAEPARRWYARRLRIPTWAVIVAGVLFVGAIGAAGTGQGKVDKLTSERDQAQSDLELANTNGVELQDSVTELTGQLNDARDETLRAQQAQKDAEAAKKAAEEERDDALDDAATAEAARNEVLTRFDPEIQAAIAAIKASAMSAACAGGDAAGFANRTKPTLDSILAPLLTTVPAAALGGHDLTEDLDKSALQTELDRCFAAAQQRLQMVGPHGDGLFTVGVEIAAGKWRSDGTGDSCYWQISPDGDPDRILSNHFGNAGGTVSLADGQEFESTRCGTWTKVG